MSGGGGSKKKKKDEPITSSISNLPMTTVQPFMPGIADMLAQQLAGGGYGDQASNLASMMQFYAPMQVPDFSQLAQGGYTPPAGTPPVKK